MVQDRHERQQGAAGTGESPNEKQTGPSRQVSGRVYRWLLALATLLLLAASWLAWQQPPHPDAYRSPPAWSSRAFWLYPQEQNAFQRLPQINAVLNSTFSLGQQVWAVGSDGILATADGGKSWQKSTYTRYPSPWFYAATVAALWLYAAAFWWRARANRRARLEVPLRRISNRVVSDKPAGPGSADLLGARQIAQGLTRFLGNENTVPPVTVAITGDWGSGKSSIMNYLFASLKSAGLKPVWFNAWHHREEQNVLASILTNINRQAIAPWWHPAGFWFRLRLLWRRHILLKGLMLAALFCFLFLLTWLSSAPDKWHDSWHYGLYLAKIE